MGLTLLVAVFLLLSTLAAEQNAGLMRAKALDKEIQTLPNLSYTALPAAFRGMVLKIRNEPKRYRLALASNLAVSAEEVAVEPEIVQSIAELLVEELNRRPEDESGDLATDYLADLAFYHHIPVSFDSPRYRVDMVERETEARVRAAADFTLRDTNGKQWHLRSLRGNFVLLNFWATWCPPCQRELPELQAVYNRYVDHGLLVLAITDEDIGAVKRYLSRSRLSFPILLDTVGVTKKQFLINGFPHSVLYNTNGKIIAQFPGPLTKREVEDLLARSGLQ